MNGGVNFGTSQSFPQGAPGSNTSFQFQLPTSKSFTFGAPSESSNPFAGLNGAADAQDIAMESPQKKAAVGNTFGSNNFTLGQSTQQQQPNNPFAGIGANQNTNNIGGNLFGQSAATSAPSNPFGPPAQSQPVHTFGQQSPALETSGISGFGQNIGVSNTSTRAPFGGFGQSTPALGSQQTTEAPAQPSKFTFGQTTRSSQGPSNGLFGSAPSQTSGLFGSSTMPPTISFGQGSAQSAAPSNPFANLVPPKPEEVKSLPPFSDAPTAALQPTGESQHAAQSPEKPTNPFAGLFGNATNPSPAAPAQKPTFSFGQINQALAPTAEKQEQPPSKPAFPFGSTGPPAPKATPDEAKTQPSKSPFAFGATSSSAVLAADEAEPKHSISSFKFGSAASAAEATASGLSGKLTSQDKPAGHSETLPVGDSQQSAQNDVVKSQDAAPKPFFKFPSQPVSSDGLSSLAKSSTDSSTTSGGLFSKLNSAVETSNKTQPMFGAQPKLASATTAPKAAFGLSPSTSGPSKPTAAPLSSDKSPEKEAEPQSVKRPSTTSTASSSAYAQAPKPTESANESAIMLEPVERPIYTKGPSRVPGHTTAERFQEYDRAFRLHALNQGLKTKVATLDPRSHDFDNIIRHYVSARENIGASLGLYVRNVAGMKRKGDQVDNRTEQPEHNKRSREERKPSVVSSKSTSASFGSTLSAPNTLNADAQSTNLDDGVVSKPAASGGDDSQATFAFNPTTNDYWRVASSSSGLADPFAPATKTPTKSPPKKPAFEMPKFGVGANTNFFAAFGQKAKENADKLEKDLLEKRKLEDFDSDEDDEETFRKRIEDENRAKRAKIESVAKKGFTPTFGSESVAPEAAKPSSSGFKPAAAFNQFSALYSQQTNDEESEVVNDDENENDVSGSSNEQVEEADEEAHDGGDEKEEAEDSLAEDEVIKEPGEEEADDDDDDNDLQAAMDRARSNPNAGKSLFDRIEPNPTKDREPPLTNGKKKETEDTLIVDSAKNSTFPPPLWGSHIGKSAPAQPASSPFTPATAASTAKPANTFSNGQPAPTTTPIPAPGASIFAGGSFKDGPLPGEGLFGSRPGTPNNADSSSSLAKSVLTSPAGTDNTWKEGGTITFGNGDKPTSAPAFKITAPSPGEKEKDAAGPQSLSSLFGTPAAGISGSSAPNLGFQFGAPVSNPAPGFLGAISHLSGGSAASSAASSRATSPGLTDNESIATNETDDTTDDPQTSLMDSRTGEENESCLFEGRSKALMFANGEMAKGNKYTANDWNSVGIGMLRVLKDKTTNKTRVVFRVEPSANILFNSLLVGSTTYESVPSNKSGAVRGALMYNGNLTRLVFKLKTPEMAKELAKILEENKSA